MLAGLVFDEPGTGAEADHEELPSFYPDPAEPLREEVSEQQREQEHEVDGDDDRPVLRAREHARVVPDRDMDHLAERAAEDRADDDVDQTDAGDAEEVVADAEGHEVRQPDGGDDEQAVVAELFVESPQAFAVGLDL